MFKKIIITFIIIIVGLVLGYKFLINHKGDNLGEVSANINQNLAFISSSSQQFRILALLPLSGRQEQLGKEISNIFEMATSELNSSTNFNGHIDLVVLDGGCEQETALNNLKKYKEIDKVDALIGGVCLSEAKVLNDLSRSSDKIFLNIGYGNKNILEDNPLTVNTKSEILDHARSFSDIIYNKKIKNIGVIELGDSDSSEISRIFVEDFKSKGGDASELSLKDSLASGQEAMIREKILDLKKGGATGLFMPFYDYAVALEITKAMKESRWFVPLILSDKLAWQVVGIASQSQAKVFDRALTSHPILSGDNNIVDMVEQRYRGRFGVSIIFKSDVLLAYDSFYFLADAFNSVAKNNQALLDWMSNIRDWRGIAGPFIIGSDKRTRKLFYNSAEIKNGNIIKTSP